jgi:hypothetical protein
MGGNGLGHEKRHLVALLDTQDHPLVSITDLARLHETEGASETEMAWDL